MSVDFSSHLQPQLSKAGKWFVADLGPEVSEGVVPSWGPDETAAGGQGSAEPLQRQGSDTCSPTLVVVSSCPAHSQ